MKIYPQIILLYVFICLSNSIFPQSFNPNFKNITVEDGLTQNTVTDILQDYDGFMWFATEDGLNRYDGFKIEQFRNIPHGKENIPVSRIVKFEQFSDSILWIETLYNGQNIAAYHKKFGFKSASNFFKALDLKNKKINSVFYDSLKNYWLTLVSENKVDSVFLVMVNQDTTIHQLLTSCSDKRKFHFTEDYKHNIWITNSKQFYKASLKNNIPKIKNIDQFSGVRYVVPIDEDNILISNYSTIIKIDAQGNLKDTLLNSKESTLIKNLFIDSQGIIWGSYGTNSIFSIENKQTNITEFAKTSYLASTFANSIVEDKNHNIWIGTSGEGILYYDRKTKKIEQIRHSNWDQSSLAHNFIDKLFIDKDNNIWAGTIERGLSVYLPSANKFKKLRNNPLDANSLSENIVRSISVDKQGHYWFATRGGGISEYDPISKNFQFHFEGSPNHFESLLFENDSILWIGTRNKGIFRYNVKTREAQLIKVNRKQKEKLKYQNYVRKIYMDSDKNIWFCTWGGLLKINPKTSKYSEYDFSNLPPDNAIGFNTVYTIIQINDKEFLIGTESGILKIDKSGTALKWYQHSPNSSESLSNNTVFSITRDTKERFWVGTFTGGLNLFDMETGKFDTYRTTNGLTNDCIYGMLEDQFGNLWIPTNSGLSCFNPEKKRFNNYFKSDGLPSSAFNFGAFCKNDQTFIMGTEEGIVIFEPNKILSAENQLHPISVTDFNVFNSDKDFYYLSNNNQSVTLKPNETVFSINMVSPNYNFPDKINYEYRIEPLSSNWINNGGNGNFIFNNLPSGRFMLYFRVKSIWGEKNPKLTIPLTIKPPFMKTLYFKTLLFALVLVIVSLIIYTRFTHFKKLEKVRLQIANDLHDEIGSNLSSISFSGYKLRDNQLPPPEIEKQGQLIMNLSKRTAESIREILWFINPQNDHISLILDKMKQLAQNLFPDNVLIISMDENIPDPRSLKIKRNLFLIYKEILNNIAKHAQADKITINICLTDNSLILTIFDSGIGFAPHKKHEGLGISSVKRRIKEINGVMDIQSRLGEGTSYTIKIPSWKKRFRLY